MLGQENPQDFELIELLIREATGVSRSGPSTSAQQKSDFESFKARFQSYIDQIPSYLHSVSKEGFFSHFFLGSFSILLDTEIAGKLGIKKVYFCFDTPKTLKIVVVKNDQIKKDSDVISVTRAEESIGLFSISEHDGPGHQFTSGELEYILKENLHPDIETDTVRGIKDRVKGRIKSKLVQINRSENSISVEIQDKEVLDSAASHNFHEIKKEEEIWKDPEDSTKTRPEDYIAELTDPNVEEVKKSFGKVLSKISEVHSKYKGSLTYANQAREAAHHGFIAGILVNFRYRYNLRVYLELFVARGYADIVLLPRGKDRSLNAVPIIMELKAGTAAGTTSGSALEQAKNYAKGFQPNTMRVLTVSDNVLCVGYNLDSTEGEKFSMHISPPADRKPARPTVQALLEVISSWNGEESTIADLKKEIKQPLDRVYHTFPGTPEKGGDYFSKFLLGQLLFADKFMDIDLEKYLFLYNEYPLIPSTRSGAQSIERPVTTFMLTKGNQGQDKEVFIFHIGEKRKGEFSKKKIPINLLKVGKITEIFISLQEERKSDFFNVEKVDRYNSLNEYKQGKSFFDGELKNIPYLNNLKEAFDDALNSQHTDKPNYSELQNKYENLLRKIGEVIFPFKALVKKESQFCGILNGILNYYSDLKLQEPLETRALVLFFTEFQTGGGKRIDVLVHGIKFAGQHNDVKEYNPVGIEVKGPRKGKDAVGLLKEAEDQIKKEYKEGVTYKTLTDGDKVFIIGVVFDAQASSGSSLLKVSKAVHLVDVIHSSRHRIDANKPRRSDNRKIHPQINALRSFIMCSGGYMDEWIDIDRDQIPDANMRSNSELNANFENGQVMGKYLSLIPITTKNLDLSQMGLRSSSQMAILNDFLLKRPQIELIDLSYNILGCTAVRSFLGGLRVRQKLSLNLSDNNFGSDKNGSGAISLLAQLIRENKISRLIIRDVGMQLDDFVEVFSALKENTSVEALDLSGNQIEGGFSQEIAESLADVLYTHERLISLKLANTGINNLVIEAIHSRAQKNHQGRISIIEQLDISNESVAGGITQEGAKPLAEFVKRAAKLQDLRLSGNYIEGEGLRELEEALRNTNIQTLDISRTCSKYGEDNIIIKDTIRSLVKQSNISVLNLAENRFGDEVILGLFSGMSSRDNQVMKRLNLSGNFISRWDDDMCVITQYLSEQSVLESFVLMEMDMENVPEIIGVLSVKTNTLRGLDIAYNGVDGSVIIELSQLVKDSSRLQLLNIGSYMIGEKAKLPIEIEGLFKAIQDNRIVTHLDISGYAIDVQLFSKICKYLRSNIGLQYLSLAGSEFTGNRAKSAPVKMLIGALKHNTNLQYLNLRGIEMTKEEVRKITLSFRKEMKLQVLYVGNYRLVNDQVRRSKELLQEIEPGVSLLSPGVDVDLDRKLSSSGVKRKHLNEDDGQQQLRKRFDPNICVRLGGRSRRSINPCLFSRSDVEKFSKGKVDENNVDQIIIDSEKFLTYVKNSQDEAKNAQLIEFIGSKNIGGGRKYLLDKVVGDQGYERYIRNERIKDLYGDVLQQNGDLTKNPKLKSRLMNAAGRIQLIKGIHDAIVSCKDGTATDCGLNLGGIGWSFASQPIESVIVKIAPKVVTSSEKVVGKVIPGTLGKQTKFAIRIAGAKFSGTIAKGTAGAIASIFDIVDIGMSVSNLVDCKKRESSNDPCGEKEIRDSIASVAFSGVSFVSGVALTAASMPVVGVAVGFGLMVGYGVYSGVSDIVEYEKKYGTTHGENWSVFWRRVLLQPMAADVQHLATRKDTVNSLAKEVWKVLNNTSNNVVAYGVGFGKVRDNTLRPDYATIMMNKKDTAYTGNLSRVVPDYIEGANRICLPQITNQNYEKGIKNLVPSAKYYCENAMVINHGNRVNMKQKDKMIVYDLRNVNGGIIVGSDVWNNNFFIYSGTERITGGNNVANRFVLVDNPRFLGKIIGGVSSTNVLDLSQVEGDTVLWVKVNYQFKPNLLGLLRIEVNSYRLIDDRININDTFDYQYVGRKNKVDQVLCMGYSEHFTGTDDCEVIIDSGGGSNNNEKDIVENCKKVIISPYTTVKGRKSNYTFYVKAADYQGRDLYSEINVKGTGTVIFPESDLLRDCDQITYSKKSNVLSLKINFSQNNQFTLDIKNYVEQGSNKTHFVLIDKNGSNIVPEIERSDLPTIEIKSFELHSQYSLDNFGDVETHYKKILNNDKGYKVFTVIRDKVQNQNNSVVPSMVYGSSGEDIINFDQGTIFARGGKGGDVYFISSDISNREVKIDNHSDDEKLDMLLMPVVEKDFLIQQCDLYLKHNNSNIRVKNYLQDPNYRHLIVMNNKGEAFIPNIQSMSCSPSSSEKGKLVPFLQATQTQNMFLLSKDFQYDHVVIDSTLEDIEKYKDEDDLLLIRESEIPFIIKMEGFYTDRSKWENISYFLWNNNDLFPSPGLLENVDNVMEYKDKLRDDYERIVKEYIEDFSDSTSIIQHNQKLKKNISTFVRQNKERIGVMVLKDTTPDQVEVSNNGTGLVLRDKRSNHTISIKGWDNNESYRISTLEFDLGLEPIKILRLNRFSLSEVGKIQDLIEKASENYQNRAKYTPKVENDFKCLVSTAGFVNKNSTYQCLGFSSPQDQISFTGNSCSLEQLYEFRDKPSSTSISALSRTLQNNLLLSGYGQDTINRCSEFMITEASDQKSRHYAIVKDMVRRELEDSMLNNLPLINTFANEVCSFNRNLCGEAIKEAVNDVYEKRDIKNILELIHNGSSITQSVQGYIAVFDAMKKKNDLNNNVVFKLSYYVKEIIERDNLDPKERSDLEDLRSKLPESVKNVVFASEVCIKNVGHGEYLCVPVLPGRKVFVLDAVLHKTHPHVQDLWKIELDGDNYRIKGVRSGKYLRSPYLKGQQPHLWHMEGIVGDRVGVWKLEADGDNVNIMNVQSGRYLCAVEGNYLGYIHRVHTCSKDDQDIGANRWKVEDCRSTRNRRSIQKSNRYNQTIVDYKLILTEEADQQIANRISAIVENIKSHILDQTKSKLDLGSYSNNIAKSNADLYPDSIGRSICNELNASERKNITLGGNNICVITSGHETLDIENLPIPEVVIYDDFNKKNSLKDTLDLRRLVQQVNSDLSIEPTSKVIRDKNDLLIKLSISATGLKQDVATVRLRDAFVNKWYKKLQIIFDNAPMEIDGNLGLKSSLFISDEKITVVRPQDIEENNKLIISKKAGQYTYLRDKYGCTLLHWAALKGYSEIAKFLVDNRANVNAKDVLGRTPMHFAVMNNHLDILHYLINNSANIGTKDSSGKTPLDVARGRGYDDIVEYLEEKLNQGRGGAIQRKRRHHHGDHNRHHNHLSSKLPAIDSRNQPEIAASSGTRPSSWINDLFSWVKSSVGRLLGSKAALPEISANYSNTAKNPDNQYTSQFGSEVCISNNVGLGFFLLQSFLDKKCPLPRFCSVTPEEALADTLNIMEEFERTLEKTAKQSGMSVKGFDFFKVYLGIAGHVRNERYSQIPNTLYSATEEAYPENKEFLNILKGNIKKMCDEQQIVNNGYQVQNTAHPPLPNDITDNKPRNYLNDTIVNNQLQRLH